MADPRVALLSLESWDDTWRRNQHVAARLVARGHVAGLTFVEPPLGGLAVRARRRSVDGVELLRPPLVVPRRYGGHRVLAAWLRRRVPAADVVWVNDPVAGGALARSRTTLVYDVTDDWRSMVQDDAERRRIVAAEDVLARHAVATTVCSAELADRWRRRYGIDAEIIANGVDVAAVRGAVALSPDGRGPHAVYVGTMHRNRVDVELVVRLAAGWPGTVHMVGPDHLDPDARALLDAAGVHRHGAVPHEIVPSWLRAADVLVCPHVVSEFTLSLDAIKAYEYLATDRPVVATPSSGFQSLAAEGLLVVDRDAFAAAARAVIGLTFPRPAQGDWDDRAAAFAAVFRRVLGA